MLLAVTVAGATALPAQNSTPWPAAVAGWQAPAAGEHPRLLFRKADVAALRQRASTPEGQAIIARLKLLLGGGAAMPELFNDAKPVNSVDEATVGKQPVGTFTMSHPVGFGMLYVLTGDKKYAELSRQCVEKIFAGQVDRDSRYNWTTPGTGFRLGFVLQSLCLSYDLCADAWPADYRKLVTETVMNMKQKKVDKNQFYTHEDLANGGGYPPGSNHYGAYLLGPGLVALTFKGEPGADDPRLAKLLATVEKNLQRVLGEGFGDHGWFAEGTSCGRIAANCGTLPLLQSLKVAGGKDYIGPRPDGRYTVLRLMHEIMTTGEWMEEKAGKYTPMPSKPLIPHRGDYGDNDLSKRPIISHMGDFAQGMGAVLPREAQAMAWIYDQFVEPGAKRIWDAEVYPHLAVYAFVNWPAKPVDPDEVLPHTVVDDKHGYYLARNRWQDKDDVLVTTLLKRGPGGYKGGAVKTGTMVWGLGDKLSFGGLSGKTAHYRAAADGSMELADEQGNALVVDYSQASGTVALLAAFGDLKVTGKKSAVIVVDVGGTKVSILTLATGEHPKPVVAGNVIQIGKQAIQLDNGRLTLTAFSESKAK